MKASLVLTAILLPLGWMSSAWANPTPPATEPVTESASLSPVEVGVSDSDQNSQERLNQLSNEINQDTSVQQQNQSPSLREVLNLPEGMVIRGTSRGGLVVGNEF